MRISEILRIKGHTLFTTVPGGPVIDAVKAERRATVMKATHAVAEIEVRLLKAAADAKAAIETELSAGRELLSKAEQKAAAEVRESDRYASLPGAAWSTKNPGRAGGGVGGEADLGAAIVRAIGDPDTINTFNFGNASASACAIVRQRRMWPRPKLSWL